MKHIGQLFYRNLLMLVMVLLVVAIALPFNPTTVSAATALSDDFNACAYNTNFWKFEDPASVPGASPVITGMFSGPGKAALTMTVPPGTSYTFSDDNMNAPRIWHAVPNADFTYKIRFVAPFNDPDDSFKIMGVLIRDNTTPSAPRFFRFDYNTRAGGLNQYLGYFNAAKVRTDIVPVTDLPGSNPTSGGLYMTVSYVKSTSTWTITYQIGESGANVKTSSFQGSTYDPTFNVTDIGLFVGSTLRHDIVNPPPPPGATMVVDYFYNLADTAFNPATTNDAITLTTAIDPSSTGSGVISWPVACTQGNMVTLKANANPGSIFAGWGGAASGLTPTTTVTMDASKTVTAKFNLGSGLLLPIFLPSIMH